ncbi:unnamed protein product (macronuclear) [Paramecium tetraurelia]|uniref:Transmembrane protein n=1 Tax=Paramecium tetraurelia TaxID=5888 RepID=A0DJY8_PARTE|nr:uncharacterized protein GSPATT00017699001 [Paramecium tetraurelia]CAK83355.1 unnamed protein product [Paramecium tetraurelia]|eukprot:XP_001450752.1 hypothetical protein (macronuclear) [Paramecium tetraurelia strain d4-2]
MMNRYSLFFKDNHLEDSYQKYLLEINRKPLLKRLIISTTIVEISDLLQIIASGEYEVLTLNYAFVHYLFEIILNLILILIFRYYPKYIGKSLLFYNHFFVTAFVVIEYQDAMYSINYQKIIQIGIIGSQFIIILQSDFIEAAYQASIFPSIYLFIWSYKQEQIYYAGIVAVVLSVLVFLQCLYEHQVALRSQFQLGFIDNQWEKIFTQLIGEQYLIFYFDNGTFSFQLSNSKNYIYKIDTTQQLKFYLRAIKLSKTQNFEQYCFEQIQSHKNFSQDDLKQNLTILFQGKTQIIQYSIFYSVRPLILLQVISKDKHINETQIQIDKKINLDSNYQFKYKKFIYLLYQPLKKKNNDISASLNCLSKIRKICLYANLQEYITPHSILSVQIFKLDYLFQKINFIYSDYDIQIDNKINLITNNKELLLMLFIEIIEKTISKHLKISTIFLENQQVLIKFTCYYSKKSLDKLMQRIRLYSNFLNSIEFDVQFIGLYIRNISLDIGNNFSFLPSNKNQLFQNLLNTDR